MTDIQRILVLAISALGIVLWLWLARDKRYRGFTIAPLSWLLAVVVFYTWTTFIRVPGTQELLANTVSRWITLYGVVLAVGAAVILLWQRNR